MLFVPRRLFSHCPALTSQGVMKVLNVAEKNDAAKNIAKFLSRNTASWKDGLSKYNKIYSFKCEVFGRECDMTMTSVSGHLLNHAFPLQYKSWQKCNPEVLFEAPVIKICPEDFINIKRTLENLSKSCVKLIIWTDCDREGENIGYEIIETCLKVKPTMDVYRAKFSEITGPSIMRAINNLERPNKNISDAVNVRSELDLRIGAAFTRFQTLRFTKVFPALAEYLLSYGSCQFPTLGFVVERYLERENFIPEPFWRIKVTHTIDNITVDFKWERDRLFDKQICEALLERCLQKKLAKVEKIEKKPKSKWRPTPLDTTEMQKLASRKLKINAKEALRIAEKLYTQGLISYPRTETNIFPPSLGLPGIVELMTPDPRWGGFASQLLHEGVTPRQGKKSDQSHPPIHPIKYTDSLQGNEARVYELIVRHFLACLSKDAKGEETSVVIDINTEKFIGAGLVIVERNYLDVYPYENWTGKPMHKYKVGDTFVPTTLEMVESETSAPPLLTEADLIALMEKHGIGTDATHAEHIETIKSRFYVGLENNVHFVPSAVGMGLVQGYDAMGFEMSKPKYRAELERDLKRICDGQRDPQEVLREQVAKYRQLFVQAKNMVTKIDEALSKYIEQQPVALPAGQDPMNIADVSIEKAFPCPQCGQDMLVRRSTNTEKFFVSCADYLECKFAIWLPKSVIGLKVLPQSCSTCGGDVKMLQFQFKPGSMSPFYPNQYNGCLRGCDQHFLEMLDVRLPARGNNQGRQPANRPPSQGPGGGGGGGPPRGGGGPPRGGGGGGGPPRGGGSSWGTGGRGGNEGSSWGNGGGGGPPRGGGAVQRGGSRPSTTITYTEQDGINCMCNVPSKKLTVRKEGPNTGREFFTCGNQEGGKCNFFLWADAPTNQPPAPKSGNRAKTPFQPRPQWDNDSSATSPQFRGRGSNATTRAPRKCSNCSQTGHTRKTCPNL